MLTILVLQQCRCFFVAMSYMESKSILSYSEPILYFIKVVYTIDDEMNDDDVPIPTNQ